MDVLELVVDALAAYRLTRLASKDTITLPIRAAIIRAAYAARDGSHTSGLTDAEWEQRVFLNDDPPKIAELVTCRWCTGMWVAFGVLAARTVAPRAWSPVARALACASGAALLAGLEKD